MKDVYWFAGLFEGEGSCWFSPKNRELRLNMGMTDKDVLDKAANLLGTKVGNPIKKPVSRRTGIQGKDFYQIALSGSRAAMWLMTLYPLLGLRRKEKIISVLTAWKKLPTVAQRKIPPFQYQNPRVSKESNLFKANCSPSKHAPRHPQ